MAEVVGSSPISPTEALGTQWFRGLLRSCGSWARRAGHSIGPDHEQRPEYGIIDVRGDQRSGPGRRWRDLRAEHFDFSDGGLFRHHRIAGVDQDDLVSHGSRPLPGATPTKTRWLDRRRIPPATQVPTSTETASSTVPTWASCSGPGAPTAASEPATSPPRSFRTGTPGRDQAPEIRTVDDPVRIEVLRRAVGHLAQVARMDARSATSTAPLASKSAGRPDPGSNTIWNIWLEAKVAGKFTTP